MTHLRKRDSIPPGGPRTIIVSQLTKKVQLSLDNDEPLTDEYLNRVLPTLGFRIIQPPPSYIPLKREPRPIPESSSSHLPRVPVEFQSLYTDLRSDEELSHTEKNERQVMRLLLQLKDGTPYQRKLSQRSLTTHAVDFGAPLIFSKMIPLLCSPILNEQERHSLLKATDRLMYRLSSSMSEFVPPLLAFAGKLLTDSDATARLEAREIVCNLAKIAGLPVILHSVRSGLDSDDKSIREVTARTLAAAALSLGVSTILPFIQAVMHSKKSWKVRHTGVRIVDSIGFQSGGGILPSLRDLVNAISPGLGMKTVKS
jgi:splicing factor 3B subunit 1